MLKANIYDPATLYNGGGITVQDGSGLIP